MNITSFKHACTLLKKLTGKNYSKLPVVDGMVEHLQVPTLNQYKIWVIAEAAREGKKLTTGYYPYFWLDRTGSGSGFSYHGSDYAYDLTAVGARHEFPDRESAGYAGKKHTALYKSVMSINKNEYINPETK